MEGMAKMGRLAMRQEGENWTAYYALPDSMDGALFLGSIRMSIVDDPDRKKLFMDLMREAVADIIEAKTGIRPVWGGEERAPGHERAGAA